MTGRRAKYTKREASPRFTADGVAFARSMLKDIGVAVTPGVGFDPERGSSYLRLCYAGPEDAMRGVLTA